MPVKFDKMWVIIPCRVNPFKHFCSHPDSKKMKPAFERSVVVVLFSVLSVFTSLAIGQEEPPGQEIYQTQCADCHGDLGKGVAGVYEEPLTGDLSIKQLTRLIERTMPDEAADECTGKEAEAVARYIHGEFYSEIAQARNSPPEIRISRLTNRQYQNAIVDLVGSFLPRKVIGEERGLAADYYYSRRFRRKDRAFSRVDPVIAFDFGQHRPPHPNASPDDESSDEAAERSPKKRLTKKERDEANAFSIRWEGSVLAPETGDYEFILQTENGAKLFVNDKRVPLIDAWVQSGTLTEHRATGKLIGGRAYPIRLECFRFKEKSASIRLLWKTPNGVEEVIPNRFLLPEQHPQKLIVTTNFPPDDRSDGYERGTSISKEWDEATTYAALEVAQLIAADFDRLAKTSEGADDRREKSIAFCESFARRAMRSPLTDDELEFFVRRFLRDGDIQDGVKRSVLLSLKSPRFLYREAWIGDFDAFDVASWLSFTLWDSIPDEILTSAANNGALATNQQIAKQARRMLRDDRTKAKVREFFHQWLRVAHFSDVVKDQETFPDFDADLVAALRTSLDMFVEKIVWSDSSDLRDLFRANHIFANSRLAEFYSLKVDEGETFRRVSWEEDQRVGVLSHPLLLAGFAYDKASSPIHRGVFVARSILGRRLKPPPIAVAPTPVDLHPDMTTRQRVTLQTNGKSCQRCHSLINSLGFAFEQFDAVGRFRETEQEQPIDASGSYVVRNGTDVSFNDLRELADFLANSEETHESFTEQMFQHMIKQPVQAFSASELPRLSAHFANNNFNMQNLLVEITASSAVRARDIVNGSQQLSKQARK